MQQIDVKQEAPLVGQVTPLGVQETPLGVQEPLAPLSDPAVTNQSDGDREDFQRVPADSAWQKFWSFNFARCFDSKAQGYDEIGVDEGPVSSREVATCNKVLTLFFGTCGFGAGDLIATAVLHSLVLYSGTRMSRYINTGSTVGDSMINGAIGGATGFLIPLPFAILGTSIGYRFNRPQFGSVVGHAIGWGIHIGGDVYLLSYKTNNNPQSVVTYDSSLTASSANALAEKIVLATDATDKNYTIHSISFTGSNRQAVQVVSPPALLSQNGTHFNITFQPPVLVFNNQTQDIFLAYANPQAIVPPIKDVTVAIYDVNKGNETFTTTYSATIHGLDVTKRVMPGLVDWQTVFSPSTNVTVDSANEIIIGPLGLNNDGTYSLLNATRDVPRYYDSLKRGVKNPNVPVKLYTSSFDPNTVNIIGGNNATCATLCNNTVSLLNDTGAAGMIYDFEGGWSDITPTPVNATNMANILTVQSLLPSGKTASITLPLNNADIIWPKASLQQVAKTGATFYPVGYRTFLPGQLAGYSSPLDILQNMTTYYTGVLGNKVGAIALSCATQCYKVNETTAFEPYVPFGRAVATALAPGQYPQVAESFYSETCLITNGDCAGGTSLGVQLIVSPPDAHSAAQQGLMVDRTSGYVCTGQMITPGQYSFDTMTNAAKVIAKSGHNIAVSNEFWDQDGDLTKAIAAQFSVNVNKPTVPPTPMPTPTNTSSSFKRADYNSGRKPLSLSAAGLSSENNPADLPSLEAVASTATYAALSSVIATLARNVMQDLLIAHKKDAAAKAAGKPEEEQSAVADYMFFLGNVSLTLLPSLYSSSSMFDTQTKLMSLAMVLAISFGLQLLNKFPQYINGTIAGTAPIALKTLENLIAGNHSVMKDVILMSAALIISSGLAVVTDKLYEPGKALLLGSVGMFGARSNNAAKRRVASAEPRVTEVEQQRSFAAV
jgi:hypothetical protein